MTCRVRPLASGLEGVPCVRESLDLEAPGVAQDNLIAVEDGLDGLEPDTARCVV